MVANWIFAVTPYLSDEIQGGRRWNDQLRLKLIEGFDTFEKKKKRREKSTSVLRLDWSSVATKVFCTQIGSMFGDFFDVFCTHRIGVGPPKAPSFDVPTGLEGPFF